MLRPAIALVALCLLTAPLEAGAQDSLKFFKNYFVTGDYAARGVALRGTGGSGIIDMSDASVPDGADIVGAFLYWQTVLKLQDGVQAGLMGARFDDQDLTTVVGGVVSSLARPVNPSGSTPCWSSGGGTGASNGTHRMITYRADVLNIIQQGLGANGQPDPLKTEGGKPKVNRAFAVVLTDAGSTGNVTPSTSGVSLVVIYRHPDDPLRSIVVHDGGFTLDNATPTMTQTISGFYQASSQNPSAKMTHIVGDGQMNFSEQVLFNGQLLGQDFFGGPAWDTVTFGALPLPANAAAATVSVTPVGSSYDCLSWSALIFSTTVQDTDEDGLLDVWESSNNPLRDPNAGCPIALASPPANCFLPNLKAMGADPAKQDIFLEIGRMATAGYATDALENANVPAHDHLPSKAVLERVATAFKNAPPRPLRSGGMISGPIRIHFDVGNNHQAGLPNAGQCAANWQASCAIIPAGLARGGEVVDETMGCQLSNGFVNCGGLFPNYPGTVGWKSGFLLLKNQPLYKQSSSGLTPLVLSAATPDPLEQQCQNLGFSCVRRFDRNRKDIFRYALFAHALGLVRVNADGNPVLDSAGQQQPKNTSGIADGGGVGGADLMMTLGLWDNYVGSEFIQASTLLHELGHTFGLRHGGGPPALVDLGAGTTPIAQPNCKPNYLSIMNYLFQVRGLVGPSGLATVDYSRQDLGGAAALDEGSLVENLSAQPGFGAMAYRTSWFAPVQNQELGTLIGQGTRRCDGTPLPGGAPLLVRVDGTTQNGLIDWNWDGDAADSGFVQDVNYNSAINDGNLVASPEPFVHVTFQGFNDFDSMDLRQVGSRRNAGSSALGGGLSLDVGFGDVGFGDVGFGDVGFGDVGFGDVGFGDVGFGDVGFGDVGFGDVGFGDVGFGDVGFGDVGFGDVGAPPGELDLDTAAGLNGPTALVATALSNRIRLTWGPPPVGQAASYTVYKVEGSAITPTTDITTVGNSLPTTTGNVTTVEDRNVRNNRTYIYFVVATLTDGSLTGPSNFVTITK